MDGVSTSSFIKGLNRDVAKFRSSADSYVDALDIRVTTDKGSSTGSITNILGNELFFTVPCSSAMYKVTQALTNDFAVSSNVTVTTVFNLTDFLGVTQNVSITTSVLGNQNYTEQLSLQIKNNSILKGLGVQYKLYNLLTLPNISGDLYICASKCTINSITITSTVTNHGISTSVIVPSQCDLTIIGWGTLRDDLIVFTTNDITDIGGYGQVWKVSYHAEDLSIPASFELLYTENIGFTTKHIIESPCVGRYETKDIKRIYWTDFHNELRSFNIALVGGLFTDKNLLDITPAVQFSKPVIQEIKGGGNLKVGYYAYAYRLLGKNGEQTMFSPHGNNTLVVPMAETTELYQNYNLDFNWGDNSHKSVDVLISDIDLNYTIIETISILQDGISSIPIVEIIDQRIIPSSGKFTLTHSGTKSTVPITFEEYTLFSYPFSKCKTLASKDNRLFAGNVVGTKFHEIRFNARTYRYRNYFDGSTTFLDTYVTDVNKDPLDPTISLTDLDAVNPFNTDDLVDSKKYVYQSDGTTIGGEGPNISYKFVTVPLEGDKYGSTVYTGNQPVAQPFVDKFRHSVTIDSGEQLYPSPNVWQDFKSPYVNASLRGYMRGETYRFGIILFDEKGLPGFVEWIGDIKFPENYHSHTYGTLPYCFNMVDRSFLTDGTDLYQELWTLGIDFKVRNLPSNISGYSIVRVVRDDANKTRLGTGLLSQVDISTGYTTILYNTLNFANFDQPVSTKDETHFCTFDSPDFQFKGSPKTSLADKIRILGQVTTGVAVNVNADTKYNRYAGITTNNNVTDLNRDLPVAVVAEVLPQAGLFVDIPINGKNYEFINLAVNPGNFVVEGSKTTFIRFSSPHNLWDFVGVNSEKILASYIRTLSEQYGGSTNVARSNNEYVLCGHYQRIDKHSDNTYFKVFGGDTYVSQYDFTKYDASPVTNTSVKRMGIIFPVETTINTDMRAGMHFAKKTSLGNTTTQLFDDFITSSTGNEDNYITYFPEPFNKLFVEEFDNKVCASEVKINGESTDNWRKFLDLNTYNVEGIYGPINKLQVLREQVYFLQDKAIGKMTINPRVLVPATELTSIQVGTGSVLEKPDYISTEYGTKHQHGVTVSDTAIFFFDVIRKKFLQFSPGNAVNPLSEIHGLSAFFSNTFDGDICLYDNCIDKDIASGVTATYDFRFFEAVFTFQNKGKIPYTIAYSELLNAFTSFYSFTPVMYINDKRVMLTPDWKDSTEFYRHNTGKYGVFYGDSPKESLIEVVVNKDPQITKAFTNIDFMSECYDVNNQDVYNAGPSTLEVSNEYQSTNVITLTVPERMRRRFRTWRIVIPRDSQGARIRGPYCNVEIAFDNSKNYRFILNDINTYYLYS